MRVSTVKQMREMDKRAMEKYGIEDKLLMENAGNAVYFAILKHFGTVKGKNFVIFSGPGNNGGDALVVARKLFSSGANIKIYTMSSPEKYSGSAKMNYDIIKNIGIVIEQFIGDNAMVRMAVESADAVIDGILGTGISRNVEGKYAGAINLINNSAKMVFSIDIPSGIAGDSGEVMGTAIFADYTVTFGLPKLGNILYPGAEHNGRIYVSHISFPPENYERNEINIFLNEPVVPPKRKKDGHKGTFGSALFVSGARGYYGAPYLSAMSFLKSGGGYARLAAPESVVPFISTEGREIVYHPIPETPEGSIDTPSLDTIKALSNKVDFVVIGPGTSLNEKTQNLMRELTKIIDKPLLIDGDALTAIANEPELIKTREKPTIITPHPGEMSRLTGITVKEIVKDRITIANNFSKNYNCTVVLKGARTVIAFPDGKTYINMSGNSGMATAGSGDVLTGTIAAMFGLGLTIKDAVLTGVFLHGLAGDLASQKIGEDGMTARDILNHLPEAVKELRKDYEKLRIKYGIEVI